MDPWDKQSEKADWNIPVWAVDSPGQAASRGNGTHKIRIKGGTDELNKNLATMFEQVRVHESDVLLS